MMEYQSFRRNNAVAHSSAYRSVLRRKRRRRELEREHLPLTLAVIAERDFLYDCFQSLKAEGGRSPGPDRVTYADLTNSEAGELVGKLSDAIQSGKYRPQATRRVDVPKPGKSDKRMLHLANISDRIVHKALHESLTPLWEPLFLPVSWGFRRRRSGWGMLADLEATMIETDRWVVAVDDVERAFDNVPLEMISEVHRRCLHLVPRETLDLVDVVLKGAAKRSIGIDQGNAYSPTALNALFHHRLDVPLTGTAESSFHRYADNLAFVCKDVPEGERLLAETSRLLEALQMRLKGTDGVTDLNDGGTVHLLGCELRREGTRLKYGLGLKSIATLRQHLQDSHEEVHPVQVARDRLLGWIDSVGPAFAKDGSQVQEVLEIASEYGFRELDSELLQERLEDSWTRWEGIREEALQRHGVA